MNQRYKELSRDVSLHHAYLVPSIDEEINRAIKQTLELERGVETRGNPDFMELSFSTLAVEDARFLVGQAQRAPLGDAKYFFVTFSFAGIEAQNALLKLLEEPTPHTHFFIFAPSIGTLVPTVRSRLYALSVRDTAEKEAVDNFFRSAPSERLAQVKKIIEEKDKAGALLLVESLEKELTRHPRTLEREQVRVTGEALYRTRRYLEGKAASVKMLLEYLAAVLPRM